MSADYLGLGTRLRSGPSEQLVRTGFGTESRQAQYLHDGLGQADLAYLLGLREASVLPERAGDRLLAAVLDLADRRPEELSYDPADGDAYNSRERMLRSRIGDDAGWLALGRTRREAGRVAFALAVRAALLRLHHGVHSFVSASIRQAEDHAETCWADLTYWQPAQVSTFGHYLLSGAFEAERHLDRIERAFRRCGLVPVAAGGVAGTTVAFPRARYLSRLALQDEPTTTRDAMWAVDGLLDAGFAAVSTTTTDGRVAEDLQLFATVPFGYVRLSDAHSRASVHLPQKRNPYALSVVRAGAALVAGRVGGLVTSLHTATAQSDNWIFNYGEVLDAVDVAARGAALLGEVVEKAEFDTQRLSASALDGFAEAADIAEHLVAAAGLDYRSAHSLVAVLASAAEARGELRLGPAEHARLSEVAGAAFAGAEPAALVSARRQVDGAAPDRVRDAARRLRHQLETHRTWREQSARAAADARSSLRQAARSAIGRERSAPINDSERTPSQ